MNDSLIDRLLAEADLCRSEGAGDIELLLDEAAVALSNEALRFDNKRRDYNALAAQLVHVEALCTSLQNKWASRPIDYPNGEALADERDKLRAALEYALGRLKRDQPRNAEAAIMDALAPKD